MKIESLILFCIFFLLVSTDIRCQDSDSLKGRVTIVQDPAIDRLIEKHIAVNEIHGSIKGYRIQIFFDSGRNSRDKANLEYARFLTLFPEQEAYIIFQEPNYKVRVGNFRNRIEAEGFIQQIKSEYPNAFIIEDNINLSKK